MTVHVPSAYALVRAFQSPVDTYLLKQPPTDISVDDLLHRLAQHKKRFLRWHLGQIHTGAAYRRSSSSRASRRSRSVSVARTRSVSVARTARKRRNADNYTGAANVVGAVVQPVARHVGRHLTRRLGNALLRGLGL